MYLRKVLTFNSALGLTIPKEYLAALAVNRGCYFEVYLRDAKTIIIKKHAVIGKKLTIND
jgi:hypothetical protein